MTDNIGFRWFVVILVLALGAWAWLANDLNQGIDLKGGYTLTYSIDPRSIRDAAEQDPNGIDAVDETVRVISTRIDGIGVRDLQVRREGADRISISAPRLSERELEAIKERMVQLGQLEFPIGLGSLASGRDNPPLKIEGQATSLARWEEATAEAQRLAAIERDRPAVAALIAERKPLGNLMRPGMAYRYMDDDRPTSIWWKPRTPTEVARRLGISADDARFALRDAMLGLPHNPEYVQGAWLYYDPDFYGTGAAGFYGRDLTNVRKDSDKLGFRAVGYSVSVHRQGEFEDYTSRYVGHPMAIVLNGEIWSAPVIESALSDNIIITGGGGGGFSEDEQAWLVNCLQAGSLRLRPVFESGVQIDPTLREDALGRGPLATLVGGLLVVVFMLFYYRFSGLVAVIALFVNLCLLLALLALFQATLTLPGIAGIILTIGMSVDANILIFERIREELRKGKTLVAAAQSGFDRAFVTIVDANLTTILTGIILYKFGVGPIKGFAVTLIAGIACSMFAGMFLARTIFATAIKLGWVKDTLSMSSAFKPEGRFDFLSKSTFWIRLSAVSTVAALVIFFASGSSKYGLDFTGGTIVRLNLTQSLAETDLGGRITAIKSDKGQKYPAVEVTRLSDKTVLDGVEYTTYDVHLQTAGGATAAELTTILQRHLTEALKTDIKSMGSAQPLDSGGAWGISFELNESKKILDIDNFLTGWTDARGASPLQTARIDGRDITEETSPEGMTEKFASSFVLEINERNLLGYEEVLKDLVAAFDKELPRNEASEVDYSRGFPKVDYVGPNVVANLKQQAVIAIVLSLLALVIYIWVRFKELKFGIAASVALFHDVSIALGVVVGLNMIGLVHVPLSLPIIAGFLTLIGYSLNDTIILFDRVRENMGNVKGSYKEVINLSINQVLSRTILTSGTTLAVVLVLFIFNYGAESPLEGIAFTLSVGIIVGTYSSIFIASPLLIWMHNREIQKQKTAGKDS